MPSQPSTTMTVESVNSEDEVPGKAGAPEGQPSDASFNQRAQNVFLRHESEIGAMGARQRVNAKISSVFRHICCRKPEAAQVAFDEDVEEGGIKQYRLEATRKTKRSCLQRILCRGGSGTGRTGFGITPNQSLAQSLHWMFRVNFFFLFALSCIAFFALTLLFAGFIELAGRLDPECVRVGENTFDHNKSPFADAFSLSWATFSTVGYGSVYPSLGNENDNPNNCVFITAICSLESFIGVLYAGFCGAILFGKVLRIQSHAQVVFSDPIVIRYGSGIDALPDQENGAEIEAVAVKRTIPCPVLEFRIVNRLFNDVGGEIMDATLHAVANVDAGDADPSSRLSNDRGLQRYKQHSLGAESTTDSIGRSERGWSSRSSESDTTSRRSSFFGREHRGPMQYRNFFSGRRDQHLIQEDPSARLIGKRIFSKMLIEASEHPFFKRVWLARHILDDTSPLLTHKVRRAIRRNGGFWPSHLNNYEAVRNSLQFNQILVSLNGVSNVSAADVYAQKIYDVVDVSIGYQFVNVLYRDGSDGALKVDTTLINDVREQNGGGGEPLMLGQ